MVEFDHTALWSNLFGGLALFLLGMDLLTRALRAVAGYRMRAIVSKLTTNRLAGVATGAVATGVVNSSSVTTVMLVSLISAGVISMSQSISLIMGANIGTTVTVQIIAFKVTHFALPMVAIGFAVSYVSAHQFIKQCGVMLMGLGLVFFGMMVMSDAMMPLRDHPPFYDLMVTLDNSLLLLLIGAVFTSIIQTSSATVAIAVAMGGQGLITFEHAIAIAIGANIGTCVTALLAAIGKPREAQRAAVVHLLFNVAGAFVWLGFIHELGMLATALTPAGAGLGDGNDAVNARHIANAHTIFNVVNTAGLIGFTDQIARLVEWLVPDRPVDRSFVTKPFHLDEAWLTTPAFAIQPARKEVARLGKNVARMFAATVPAILNADRRELRAVAEMQYFVDVIHGQIIDYLRRAVRNECAKSVETSLAQLMHIADQFAHIGTIIESNLVRVGFQQIHEGPRFATATQKLLARYHRRVYKTLNFAVRVAGSNDEEAAAMVRDLQDEITKHANLTARRAVRNLEDSHPGRLQRYRQGMEIIEHMTRIYDHCRRIAATVGSDRS